MADETKKKPGAAVADRLKAMFKALEDWPMPDKMREAGERLEDSQEAPAPPKETPRRGS